MLTQNRITLRGTSAVLSFEPSVEGKDWWFLSVEGTYNIVSPSELHRLANWILKNVEKKEHAKTS